MTIFNSYVKLPEGIRFFYCASVQEVSMERAEKYQRSLLMRLETCKAIKDPLRHVANKASCTSILRE